jgi:hypothetical protein
MNEIGMSCELDRHELFCILSQLRATWTQVEKEMGMNFVGQ